MSETKNIRVKRWIKAEAVLAVDDMGWVRGVIVPDGYLDGIPEFHFADALNGTNYCLERNLRKAKAHVRLRIEQAQEEAK